MGWAPMRRSGAWQGPGLSPIVAKFVSVQVEVGDGRVGLQGCGNVLAKTKHDLPTVQFGAFLEEEMPTRNSKLTSKVHGQNHFASGCHHLKNDTTINS